MIWYKKVKSIYVNLHLLSKGLDVLYENQNKILELTNVKGFVQLVNTEAKVVKDEIETEKTKSRVKKT